MEKKDKKSKLFSLLFCFTLITASDYAKSQGLYVALSDNNAFWALRTPYPSQSYQIRYVTNTSSVTYDSIDKTSLGVRPACYIDIK